MLISIKEYAEKHHRSDKTVYQKIQKGGFQTARKIGNSWVIDSEEPYIDNRVTSGEYVNWRDRHSSKFKKGK